MSKKAYRAEDGLVYFIDDYGKPTLYLHQSEPSEKKHDVEEVFDYGSWNPDGIITLLFYDENHDIAFEIEDREDPEEWEAYFRVFPEQAKFHGREA